MVDEPTDPEAANPDNPKVPDDPKPGVPEGAGADGRSSPSVKDEISRVLQANQRFYQAHEDRDLLMLESVWEHSSRAICIHPGWPALKGWPAIKESWSRIFAGPGRSQFILTNITGTMHGNVAWVVLDENLMDESNTGTIAATNIFIRTPGGWRLTLHQGSPVARRPSASE